MIIRVVTTRTRRLSQVILIHVCQLPSIATYLQANFAVTRRDKQSVLGLGILVINNNKLMTRRLAHCHVIRLPRISLFKQE